MKGNERQHAKKQKRLYPRRTADRGRHHSGVGCDFNPDFYKSAGEE